VFAATLAALAAALRDLVITPLAALAATLAAVEAAALALVTTPLAALLTLENTERNIFRVAGPFSTNKRL